MNEKSNKISKINLVDHSNQQPKVGRPKREVNISYSEAANRGAVVWDFDGTIIAGSRDLWAKVEALALLELGVEKFGLELPDDIYEKVDALSHEDTLKYFRRSHGLRATQEEWKKAIRKHLGIMAREMADVETLRIRDHVLTTMKYTRDLDMKAAIATMSDPEDVEMILEATTVPLEKLRELGIELVLTPIDLRLREMKGKPAPDIYRLAADKLEVSPANCVAIEDTPDGARAAAGANYALVICRAERSASRFRFLQPIGCEDSRSEPRVSKSDLWRRSNSAGQLVVIPPDHDPAEIIKKWRKTSARTRRSRTTSHSYIR